MKSYQSRVMLSIIPLSVLFSGCFSFGNFSTDRVHNIQVHRSTRQEIDSLFGHPEASSEVGHSMIYTYDYAEQNPEPQPLWIKRKNLIIEFMNDTVNAFILNNSIDEHSTDFNDQLQDSIVAGQSDTTFVRTLLDMPSGIIFIPTNIFSTSLLKQLYPSPPDDATEAWIYYYMFSGFTSQFGRTDQYKSLLVYFNNNGVVVKRDFKRYPNLRSNPFSPATSFDYVLPEAVCVSITIYDVYGNVLMIPVLDVYQEAGIHIFKPDASMLIPGVYFYKIDAGPYSSVRKFVVIK